MIQIETVRNTLYCIQRRKTNVMSVATAHTRGHAAVVQRAEHAKYLLHASLSRFILKLFG